jgi:hypothetical protein
MDGNVIVHHISPHRDSSSLGYGSGGTATVQSPQVKTYPLDSPIIFIHESGHLLHNLSDEYCCDGGYYLYPTTNNVFKSYADCENYAKTHNISYLKECYKSYLLNPDSDLFKALNKQGIAKFNPKPNMIPQLPSKPPNPWSSTWYPVTICYSYGIVEIKPGVWHIENYGEIMGDTYGVPSGSLWEQQDWHGISRHEVLTRFKKCKDGKCY